MTRVIIAAEDMFKEKAATASALHTRQHPPAEANRSKKVCATAEVNHGRWVVRCPLHAEDGSACGGAQFAHRSDRRFFCVTCGNAEVGGAWVSVKWPKSPEKIEKILLERSERKHRNWSPGETLRSLAQENGAHPEGLCL